MSTTFSASVASSRSLRRTEPTFYRQKMERFANRFGLQRQRLKRLEAYREQLAEKYADIAEQRAGSQLVILLVTIAFGFSVFLTVVFSGQIIWTFFQAIRPDWLPPILLLGMLPFTLFATSLFAVHAFQFETSPHPVEPRRPEYAPADLAKAIAISLVFFGLLGYQYYEGVQLSKELPELRPAVNYLLIVGIVEFVLGFMAVRGWNLIYFQLRSKFDHNRRRWYESRLKANAGRTARTTDHYLEAEYLLALQEARPPHFDLTPAVKDALAYHQRLLREDA